MAGQSYDPRETHRMEEGISQATRAQMEEHAYRMRVDERTLEPSDARISSQLSFMQEQVSITHKMFEELTSRLEPVLIPDMDEGNVIPGPPRKMASELSNTVDDLNGQLRRLQGRIDNVLRRVQL